MPTRSETYRIGQSVRILPGYHRLESALDLYTVLRCNEPESANPSYVLQNDGSQRQRREFHDQLVAVVAGEDRPAAPISRQERE